MKKLLIDTSVIIDFLRRQDKEQSLFYTLAREKYLLYISIISHTELFAGKACGSGKRHAMKCRQSFPVSISYPWKVAYRKKRGKSGRNITPTCLTRLSRHRPSYTAWS